MGLVDEIPPGARVALDTSALIYFIEEEERFGPLLDPVFQAIDDEIIFAVCSVVTLLEVLVGPLRFGHQALAQRYRDVLMDTRRFSLMFVTASLAEQGAMLRAEHGLTVPDAMIAATALATRCHAVISNDSAFERVPGFQTLVLSTFAGTEPPS